MAFSDPVILENELGRRLHDLVKAGDPGKAYELWTTARRAGNNSLLNDERIRGSAWQRITAAA